ncbi:MAG TPA: nicotinate-nucleotide--dimethylbenzimidazole phosphoribosyltransferase, partial [Candidatus Omnitrophota bacterium]|nr:nicotinate-nucleotide--dimethylbenzimidazole phosphoribosyltransferase [Candidatus Omnitrophota bacterium]
MKLLKNTVKKITDVDQQLIDAAQKRLDNLTKPVKSLGKLEELARQICGITNKEKPELKNKVIFTFAADHGVAEEKVSAFPQEVTAQMVSNFLNGGAGINVLARHAGARVVVADIGIAARLDDDRLIIKKVGSGTKNMAKGPAMTRTQAIKSIETGIEIFENELKNGIDICGTGEMGIANTTASSALTALFTKKPVKTITGRGCGINDSILKNKIRVIRNSLGLNRPDADDPIDALAKVGGF